VAVAPEMVIGVDGIRSGQRPALGHRCLLLPKKTPGGRGFRPRRTTSLPLVPS